MLHLPNLSHFWSTTTETLFSIRSEPETRPAKKAPHSPRDEKYAPQTDQADGTIALSISQQQHQVASSLRSALDWAPWSRHIVVHDHTISGRQLLATSLARNRGLGCNQQAQTRTHTHSRPSIHLPYYYSQPSCTQCHCCLLFRRPKSDPLLYE